MDTLLKYLQELPDYLLYLFLSISAFMENLFPPFPGDTIIAFGAFLAGNRRLHFTGVYISTTLGSILGFISLFMLGGFLGRKFFIKNDYKLFSKAKILKSEAWFRKYGYFLILINRFLPGIRSVIPLVAGISRLNIRPVFFLALISCSIWNFLWMLLGHLLGNNWTMVEERISSILAKYNITILTLSISVILFLIIRRVCKRAI